MLRSSRKPGPIAWAAALGILVVPVWPRVVELRSAGQSRESIIHNGETHTFSIALVPGQYARVEVDPRNINLILGLTGPHGRPRLRMDGSDYGREAVSLLADDAGVYQIQVIAPTDESTSGWYRIRLAELRPAVPADRLIVKSQETFASGMVAFNAGTRESFTQAIALFRESAEWARLSGDRLREGQALTRLGVACARTGEYEKALTAWKDARLALGEAKDEAALTEVLWHIGNLKGHVGIEPDFVPSGEGFLKIWRRLRDKAGEIVTLRSMGVAARDTGELDKAAKYELIALALGRELGKPTLIAGSLLDLVDVELRRGRLAEVRGFATEALHIYESQGNQRGLAAGLFALGLVESGDKKF